MDYGTVRTERDVQAVRPDGDCVSESCLVDGAGFAEPMTQRMLRWSPGRCRDRRDPRNDLLMYVLSGRGVLHTSGQAEPIEPGSAAFIPAGERWAVEVADADELLASCTAVPAPPGPGAVQLHTSTGPWRLTKRLGAQARQAASSDREFEVLYSPASGCGGATQFVGFIPDTGAPEHYHLYDEICVIVRGTGQFLARDSAQDLVPGSTFHVPPRLLHSVRNAGQDDLWILGVFRPASSPAAAYYPDGREAPNFSDHLPE